MLRLLFFTTFCIASFILTECRMGWKINGTEYLVYSANTSFSSTNSLNITGKFSLIPGTTETNRLLTVTENDANGMYSFEVYISSWDKISNVVRNGNGTGTMSAAYAVPNIRSGNAFDFTITVTQSHNVTYSHTVKTEIRGHPALITTTKDDNKWDLDKMKLYVGGYSRDGSLFRASYFYGCLSNVMFQGVDTIATYFSQYPNNTNPVRGSASSQPYATAAQNCNDVMSTVGPTASTFPTPSAPSTAKITPKPSAPSIAKTTPTKKPGAAAASYKASVFILVVAFLFPLFSF